MTRHRRARRPVRRSYLARRVRRYLARHETAAVTVTAIVEAITGERPVSRDQKSRLSVPAAGQGRRGQR